MISKIVWCFCQSLACGLIGGFVMLLILSAIGGIILKIKLREGIKK